MPLVMVLLICAFAYVLLDRAVIPAAERQWKSSSTTATVSRAGLVAALTTLKGFMKLALLVFAAAFLVLAFLSLSAPVLGGSLVAGLHDSLAELEGWTKALRDDAHRLVLWLCAAALFYLTWRYRRGQLRSALAAETDRQWRELEEKHRLGTLPELPHTEPMKEVAQRIHLLKAAVRRHPLESSLSATAQLASAADLIREMQRMYAVLDLDRRIDLSAMPVVERNADGRWAWLRLGLFNRGVLESGSFVSKTLSRAATALACLLMIGVSSPALAQFGLLPTLSDLNSLQVLRTEKAAAESLRRIALEAEDDQEQSLDEEGNFRIAAEQFVHALATSRAWVSASERALPERGSVPAVAHAEDILEEVPLRQEVLREYEAGLQRAAPGRGASVVLAPLGEIPETTRASIALVRDGPGLARGGNAYDRAVGQVEKWLLARASSHPPFREWLANGVAKFRQPVTGWDAASKLLGEGLSEAIVNALPDPAASGLLEKKIAGAGRGALETASERLVRLKLNAFLRAAAAPGSYGRALAEVGGGTGKHFVWMRDEAAAVRNVFERVDAERVQLRLALDRHPPSLVQRVGAGERNAARTAVEALNFQSMSDEERKRVRARVEGSLGDYETFFPGQQRKGAETAFGEALRSAATEAGANLPFGFDLPQRPKSASLSRSFARLSGSFRVGGVLIGTQPDQIGGLDFAHLNWAVEGPNLRLELLDRDGRRIPLGTYRGSVIRQALAYAADGRPTAVTMTMSPLTPRQLRVHVHPALVDTELGCTMIELDRFVDGSPGRAEFGIWEDRVKMQLAIYQHAAAGSGLGTVADPSLDPSVFGPEWRLNDPAYSVFAALRHRFDGDLLARLQECAGSGSNYSSCVGSWDVPRPPESVTWSGVRESRFSLAAPSFLGALPGSRAASSPLRFMLQVAFQEDEEAKPAPCDGAACDGEAERPWEFPMLAQRLNAHVHETAAKDARKAAILARAEEFTLLQRLFRAAFAGQLGRRFDRSGLVPLMRAASEAEQPRSRVTPRWSNERRWAVKLLEIARDHPGAFREILRRRGTSNAFEAKASARYLDLLVRGEAGAFSDEAACAAGA